MRLKIKIEKHKNRNNELTKYFTSTHQICWFNCDAQDLKRIFARDLQLSALNLIASILFSK